MSSCVSLLFKSLHRCILLTVNNKSTGVNYLLHHGPKHSHLVLVPRGGLCNRLSAILAGLCYVRHGLYKSITINWLPSDHCPIAIDEFCTIKADCDIVYDTVLIHTHPQYYLARGYKFDGIAASNFWQHPSDLRLGLEEWKASACMIDWNLPEPICLADYGLHCRRSDWGHHLYNTTDGSVKPLHHQLDVDFTTYVLNRVSGEIFIASDSNDTIRHIKSELPHLHYQAKQEYPLDSKRSHSMLREALIDLSTLSKSRTIIRDSNSTFPFMAHIIGGNELITWPRTVLHSSGCGYVNQPSSDYHINK